MGSDSEFLKVLKLIARIVQWCLEFSLDAVLVTGLVLAFLLPWRTACVVTTAIPPASENRRNEFRIRAILHIGWSIVDLVILPFAIVAFMIPTRTRTVVGLVRSGASDSHDSVIEDISYDVGIRVLLMLNFFLIMFDIPCLIMGIVACSLPWRTWEMIRVTAKIITMNEPPTRRETTMENVLIQLDYWWLCCGVGGILDCFSIVFGIFSMLIPSRSIPLMRELMFIVRDREWPTMRFGLDSGTTSTNDIPVFPWTAARMLACTNAVYALLDLMTTPFLIATFVTAVRFLPLVVDLRRDWCNNKDEGCWFGRTAWHAKLRAHVVRHGLLLLIDIFFLPFFVISFIACYRAPAVVDRMRGDALVDGDADAANDDSTKPPLMSANIGWKTRAEVLRQSGFLLCDLLVAPFLLVLTLSGYRLKDLQGRFNRNDLTFHAHVLKNANVVLCDVFLLLPAVLVTLSVHRLIFLCNFHEKVDSHQINWRTRKELLRQAALAVCDLAICPFLFLVQGTVYSRGNIAGTFNPQTLTFHGATLISAVIVLHDVFIMCPLLFLLCITVRRFPSVVQQVRTAGQRDETQEKSDTALARGRISIYEQTGRLLVDLLTLPCLIIVFLTCYRFRHLAAHPDKLALQFNWLVFTNGMYVLHDLVLFVPVSLVMLLTVYRSGIIVAKLKHSLTMSSRKGAQKEDDAADPENHNGQDSVVTWDAITHDMIAEDDVWADLVDWSVVSSMPQTEARPPTRTDCWLEFGRLVFDIPFILLSCIVFAIVWRAPTLLQESRKRSRAIDRRRSAAQQFFLTIRDLFMLPFFILVLFSHRSLRLMTQLCARRNRPLRSSAALSISAVQIDMPEAGNPKIRISAQSVTRLSEIRQGSIGLQVVGAGFWANIARNFGSVAAGAGQSMLPKKLNRTDTDAYQVFHQAASPEANDKTANVAVNISITIPFKVKRSAIEKNLGKLDATEWMLIQLEATDQATRKKFVVCSAALQIAALVALARSGGGAMNAEELGGEDIVLQCQGAPHKGLVDSFFTIVALEFVEWCLDLTHFLLFWFVLLVPWRFVALVACLFEPKSRWPCRVGMKALASVNDVDLRMKEIREELVPLCNNVVKDVSHAEAWCTSGKIPGSILKFSSNATRERKQLLKLLRSLLKVLPGALAENICTWVDLQDVQLYYTTLRCYLHCLLTANHIQVEEHGALVEQVRDAEQAIALAQEQAKDQIHIEFDKCWAEARSSGCRKCGFWRKDPKTVRRIVRAMAAAAVIDVVGLVLCSLVLVTVYRIPLLIKDLCAARVCVVGNTFKMICIRNLRAFAQEVCLALQVLLFFCFLVVTLIRLPEALEDAVSEGCNLSGIRNRFLTRCDEVLNDVWEIFFLLGFLKTYKLLFRAVLQCVLVPPVCLIEFLGKLSSCVPLGLRFCLSFIIFYGLAFTPVLIRLFSPSVTPRLVWWICLGVLTILMAVNIAASATRDAYRRLPADDWAPPTLRMTICNFVSVITCFMQPMLLCALIVDRHSIASISSLAIPCQVVDYTTLIGICVVVAWLLVVSLMFVSGQSDEHQQFQRSPVFRSLQLLLSHTLFLPVVFASLAPYVINNCDFVHAIDGFAWRDVSNFATLCTYLLTTQMLSGDSGLLDSLPKECGIDVRYPALYTMGAQFCDVLVFFAMIALEGERLQLATASVAMLLSMLWTCLYERLYGAAPCCIPEMIPLRLGAGMAVAWTSIILLARSQVSIADDTLLQAGLMLILCITTIGGIIARRRAKPRRQKLVDASGIKDVVARMMETEDAMCVKEAIAGRWAEAGRRERWQKKLNGALTERSLAQHLLEFEEAILAERLSGEFLGRRPAWRKDIAKVNNFVSLLHLANELRNSLRTPSTIPAMTKVAAQLLTRDDLATNLVDYLVGHSHLKELFDAALLTAPSQSFLPQKREKLSPKGFSVVVHCKYVRLAMQDVLHHFHGSSSIPIEEPIWKSAAFSEGVRLYDSHGFSYTTEPTQITSAGRQASTITASRSLKCSTAARSQRSQRSSSVSRQNTTMSSRSSSSASVTSSSVSPLAASPVPESAISTVTRRPSECQNTRSVETLVARSTSEEHRVAEEYGNEHSQVSPKAFVFRASPSFKPGETKNTLIWTAGQNEETDSTRGGWCLDDTLPPFSLSLQSCSVVVARPSPVIITDINSRGDSREEVFHV